MKATEAKFLEFLKKSTQFVIPIYQRTYSWTEKECKQLWEDILKAGQDDAVSAHFMGSIVYIQDGLYSVSDDTPLLVIDGQQRLTSLTLLLEALARAVGESEPIKGFSAQKIRNYYLINPSEEGEDRFKLILSQNDKTTLIALVNKHEIPAEHSIRIIENFQFFERLLTESGQNLEALCKGLSKLIAVDVSLERGKDNPQLIFESMNSTGLELAQADMIRNFMLMSLQPDTQKHLYEHFWRPMEVDFGQEAYVTHFDAFIRDYLTVRTGQIPNVRAVYDAYKSFARTSQRDTKELIEELRTYSRHYCAIVLGAEKDDDLKRIFHDIRELKVDVAYPLLLEMYHDYKHELLTKDDFIRAARLIESYVFRRVVVAIPTNSLNKTFAALSRSVDKSKYLESLEAQFQLMQSQKRFPTDQEFAAQLPQRDLYAFRKGGYWLRRMENHGRKERVPVEEYTIEHIMPQSPNRPLSAAWRRELGDDWERVHATYLHTLGNLTLTGYNSEYSDKPYQEKRDMAGGFGESPLRLNEGLGQVEIWNEEEICRRAAKLTQKALSVWAAPSLRDEVLNTYRPKGEQGTYTIEDHPKLLESPVRELFEAFRRHVLALDSSVTEEFLKPYVAYKSETNFVDVVPRTKKLVLHLNIDQHQINDPHKLCRDVSKVGHLGNGEVEVTLSSQEELPQVIDLVRQSLEQQLDNPI